VLLGFKKRGFGASLYNGFGGKIQDGETPLAAALRELEEEAGIQSTLSYAGTLLFASNGSPILHHVSIFRGTDWTGVISESEEMRPEWFALPGNTSGLPIVPFERMWVDDPLWFPFLLRNQPFIGRVDVGRPVVENDLTSAPLMKWWFGEPRDVGNQS